MRLFVILLFVGWFSSVMIYNLYQGLKNGRIGHSDSTSYYNRKSQPLRFWAIFTLNVLFAVMGILIILQEF